MPKSYPIPFRGRVDERFTWPLIVAVAEVLTDHGYPSPLNDQRDSARLQQHLFRYLYLSRQGELTS
ncbi:hypothetical protein HNR23_000788 [Nocardiopsis mwathae]|uniref:Uncharacterized protein n=1 Tax=Nocardiopsis mwathae TaxID=1472723 RepID=A0A7W9YEK2_9ACTN|nr:hypothetical protein [Nocardiopsis mwathae]MBB6170728.1 hypothetical protein [Nocardiopsis mwathae]